jgi:hypothetical protein
MAGDWPKCLGIGSFITGEEQTTISSKRVVEMKLLAERLGKMWE